MSVWIGWVGWRMRENRVKSRIASERGTTFGRDRRAHPPLPSSSRARLTPPPTPGSQQASPFRSSSRGHLLRDIDRLQHNLEDARVALHEMQGGELKSLAREQQLLTVQRDAVDAWREREARESAARLDAAAQRTAGVRTEIAELGKKRAVLIKKVRALRKEHEEHKRKMDLCRFAALGIEAQAKQMARKQKEMKERRGRESRTAQVGRVALHCV